MSAPHTGYFAVEIHGRRFSFDGDHWTAADEDAGTLNILHRLNAAVYFMQHYSCGALALGCMKNAGFTGKVLESRNDAWNSPLPDGAVD